MRRGLLFTFVVIALVAAACGGPPKPRYAWLEPVADNAPLPDKTAVLVDAVFQRRALDGRIYVSIEDSIAEAAAISDEADQALGYAHWTAAVKNKHFIAAYRSDAMLAANREAADVYQKAAPLHLDPAVCRTAKTNAELTALWRAVQQSFAGGPKTLPVEMTRDLGSRFQVDTLVFAIAVSRKATESGAAPAPGANADVIPGRSDSLIAVDVVRAVDGAVVYQSIVDIADPQRDSTIRSAASKAFADIARRRAQPAYPTPAAPKVVETPAADAADSADSPWVQPRAAAPAASSVDAAPGRAGRLLGYRPVSVMQKASALGAVVVTLPPGTQVRVLDRDNAWYKIQAPNNAVGWVPVELVEMR